MTDAITGGALCALAVALAACGGRDFSAYDQDSALTRELRAHGADTWGAAGIETANDYLLAVIPHDELQVVCEVPAGKVVWACTFNDERAIFIGERSPEHMRLAVVHELGHLTRSTGGHLDCDDAAEAVMCAGSSADEVTERDVAFVRGQAHP